MRSEPVDRNQDCRKMHAAQILNSITAIPRNGGFRQPGFHIWGSSVVKGEDGRFHMFASRIPDFMRFHPGWMIASEIVRATADTPVGPYQFEEVVLPARGAQYWDGCSTHNPRILKIDGHYVLYYMGSTHPFEPVTPDNSEQLTLQSKWAIVGRANKRVGIAVSKSVFGPWKRLDAPILPTKPETFYSFLTSNPSACRGKDGKVYLMFKARRYVKRPSSSDTGGMTHSDMMIGMAVADHFAGPYRVINEAPLFAKDSFGEIEDPFMWSNADGFHLLAKDQNGTITGQHGCGVLAHSVDALNWRLDEAPLAYTRSITWNDGTTQQLGNMERCSGLFDEAGNLTHLFFAIWEGKGGFGQENPSANARNIGVPLSSPV
jgi:hypothetical protein